MRISDWSSDVCSSDLGVENVALQVHQRHIFHALLKRARLQGAHLAGELRFPASPCSSFGLKADARAGKLFGAAGLNLRKLRPGVMHVRLALAVHCRRFGDPAWTLNSLRIKYPKYRDG